MKLTLIILALGVFSSCATIHDFFYDFDPKPKAPPLVKEEPAKEPATKYSEMSNYAPPSDRQYKRMTREKMEDESELQAGAGSLWVMEGQTSYLFAQNKHRREGDPTTLKVEGMALKTVKMKAEAIKDLLIELENQKKQAEEKKRKDEEEQQRLAEVLNETKIILVKNEADNDEAAKALAEKRVKDRKPASVPVVEPPRDPKLDEIDYKEVGSMPMKISEKLSDGQYRVSGFQYLTIKNRPYKIVATGIIRGEDFNDQTISSEKLYESQFDLVHIKKAQ